MLTSNASRVTLDARLASLTTRTFAYLAILSHLTHSSKETLASINAPMGSIKTLEQLSVRIAPHNVGHALALQLIVLIAIQTLFTSSLMEIPV